MSRWALLVVALLLAGAVPEPDGYRLDDYRAPVPDTVAGGRVVTLAEMQDLVAGREAVLVDVLPAPREPPATRPGLPWLPAPHWSLPGALWWPDVGRGALTPEVEAGFRHALERVSDGKRREIVFFCLSQCWMSWNATKRAASWGFRAAWFPEGVDGWQAAGQKGEFIQPRSFY